MSALSAPVGTPSDLRSLGRWIGLLYLALIVLGMLGPLSLERLVVSGDPEATTAEIEGARWLFQLAMVAWVAIVAVDLVVSLALYRLLLSGGQGLAAATAGFRLAYTVSLAALVPQVFSAHRLVFSDESTAADRAQALRHLEAFGDGFLVVLVFFGVHLVLLGFLAVRSGRLPAIFGPLLAAAGAGYVVDCFANYLIADYGGAAAALVLAPAVIGEVGLTFWLLARGALVDPGPKHDLVSDVTTW